jgi:hypothetical protein
MPTGARFMLTGLGFVLTGAGQVKKSSAAEV